MSRILTTKDSLMNYAAWYAMCYLPSLQKLHEALMKKSQNNGVLADSVMVEMSVYISEERTVEGLVRMYVDQGKTRPYIEQKLKLKKFGNDVITTMLDSYSDSFICWDSYERLITQKIHQYIEKNKSGKYIFGMLVQKYPNFKNEINSLLDELSLDEGRVVHIELLKLSQKHDLSIQKERQKVVQKLSYKGFSYDAIQKVMKELIE